jgi:hypothetical protein
MLEAALTKEIPLLREISYSGASPRARRELLTYEDNPLI